MTCDNSLYVDIGSFGIHWCGKCNAEIKEGYHVYCCKCGIKILYPSNYDNAKMLNGGTNGY